MSFPSRNHALDLFRFVAATWVAFYHFNELAKGSKNLYTQFCSNGWLGVPVFFIISGYCILQSALTSKNAFDFLKKRLLRIFPAYWLSLMLTVGIICLNKILFGSNTFAPLPHSIREIIYTFFLITFPIYKIEPVNWVYWSLTCELCFYFVITLILLLKKDVIYYSLITVVSLLSVVYQWPDHGIFHFLYYWPTFGIGIGLYGVLNKKAVKKTYLLFLVILTFNFIALIKTTSNFYIHDSLLYIIASIVTAIGIVLSKYIQIKESFFSKMGNYSYGIYLFHVPVGIYLLSFIKIQFFSDVLLLKIIYDVIVYSFVCYLAFLSYKYFEKPILTMKKLSFKPEFN